MGWPARRRTIFVPAAAASGDRGRPSARRCDGWVRRAHCGGVVALCSAAGDLTILCGGGDGDGENSKLGPMLTQQALGFMFGKCGALKRWTKSSSPGGGRLGRGYHPGRNGSGVNTRPGGRKLRWSVHEAATSSRPNSESLEWQRQSNPNKLTKPNHSQTPFYKLAHDRSMVGTQQTPGSFPVITAPAMLRLASSPNPLLVHRVGCACPRPKDLQSGIQGFTQAPDMMMPMPHSLPSLPPCPGIPPPLKALYTNAGHDTVLGSLSKRAKCFFFRWRCNFVMAIITALKCRPSPFYIPPQRAGGIQLPLTGTLSRTLPVPGPLVLSVSGNSYSSGSSSSLYHRVSVSHHPRRRHSETVKTYGSFHAT